MKLSPFHTTNNHDAATRDHPDLAPPWNSPETWHEANQTVAYLIERHRPELNRFVKLFQDVKGRLERLIPWIDELCANTCPWCPAPCCLFAVVWFDFADLLFLHLSSQQIPPSQPQQVAKIPCRYLGARGCTLPRISRPWICTWYLCDSQLANLRKRDDDAQDIFNQALQAVKEGRREMEAEFIRVVAKNEVEESKSQRSKDERRTSNFERRAIKQTADDRGRRTAKAEAVNRSFSILNV